MRENPEFLKAFPHLQKAIGPEYLNNTTTKHLFDRKDLKSDSANQGYFESLMLQHNEYLNK